MRIKAYNLMVLALVLFMAVVTPKAHATSTTSSEYKVKAAFLYNFIKFVDWPKGKIPDGNEPIIIAIIGNVSGDPFGKAFEPIKDKSIKGRNVVIMRFKSLKEIEESRGRNKSTQEQQIEEIRKCHLLFIHSSEKDRLKKILNMVKDHHVLTVGDAQDFLEAGGIINFVMEEKKVRFEINVATAKEAKLRIRSQLLRLAKRIIE